MTVCVPYTDSEPMIALPSHWPRSMAEQQGQGFGDEEVVGGLVTGDREGQRCPVRSLRITTHGCAGATVGAP